MFVHKVGLFHRPDTRFEQRWQQRRTRNLPSFHPSHKVQTFKRPIPATQESIYALCTGFARRSFFLSLPIPSRSERYWVFDPGPSDVFLTSESPSYNHDNALLSAVVTANALVIRRQVHHHVHR